MKGQLTLLRWVCVLPAACASFYAAIFLAIPFDNWVYEQAVRLGFQAPIDEEIPPYIPLPWYGAFAAVVVVLSGAAVAPAHRRVVALVLFVLGALVAMYCFVGLGSGIAARMSGPLVGGALAVGGVFVATRRAAVRLDQVPPGSTTRPSPVS